MPGRLEGKVAIVTGGGGGFGKGIAEKFIAEGAKVIIADFAEEVGQKTASELKCEFAKCNVTSREDWQNVLKLADEKFGKLDIVINNAGTTYRNKVGRSTALLHISVADKISLRTMLRTRTSIKSSQSMSSRSTTQPIPSYLTCRRRVTVALL